MTTTEDSAGAVGPRGGRASWRDAVVYEVYIRSFADSDGDGVGDLEGLRSRLPYLRELGVDALWITPFYRSPMADHGYDVADPVDVDPLFGDLAAFDRVLVDAHDLGLKVLIDVIPNHSSDQHPAFRAALAAPPGSPERSRYLFRDGRGPDGAEPPNNWVSVFGGPAWTRVPDGQWYLHLFAPEQPDWDWRDRFVWDEYDRVLRFWLDRGVDGFRIDVAHGLMKDPTLADHPSATAASPSLMFRETVEPGAWDRDEVHEVYRRWRSIVDEYDRADGRQRVLAGETWVADPRRLANYVRPDELHLAFSFTLLTTEWWAPAWRAAIDGDLCGAATVGAPTTWALANHDVSRPVTRYGGGEVGTRRARAALMTALALPGVMFLYQGDELALPDAPVPPEDRRDPVWERSGHTSPGRDACRVPIPWSGTQEPYGFSPPTDGGLDGAAAASGEPATGRPWLPQPPQWAELSVAAQVEDPLSTLNLVRSALAIRRALPALGGGQLHFLDRESPYCVIFNRVPAVESDEPGAGAAGRAGGGGGPTVTCVLSTAPAVVDLELPGQLILASEPVTYDGTRLALPPDTAVWIAARPSAD